MNRAKAGRTKSEISTDYNPNKKQLHTRASGSGTIEMPHVIIWLDRPGMKAAAYVAMSRVRRDNEYLLGGILTQAHVVPNA